MIVCVSLGETNHFSLSLSQTQNRPTRSHYVLLFHQSVQNFQPQSARLTLRTDLPGSACFKARQRPPQILSNG